MSVCVYHVSLCFETFSFYILCFLVFGEGGTTTGGIQELLLTKHQEALGALSKFE